ncbi:isochorismatase family protein [Yersinia nurmii]|uniref:isochorismatase n=1 Tax=Yersinia nurmii TaxID=685706 RepID=A0AAW7JUA8_9GAMM|nr:isochorismatase [Yersinia nurmii]MDN0086209.1 isochorismatase family protein [Yersinia nurmii]CNE46296.1 Isochorismatase [Yersinia nurmii]
MAIPTLSAYQLPQAEHVPANKVGWQFDPTKAVLLIHDMQDYFVSFYGDNNPMINRVIDNIADIRRYCKRQGVPVIYTAQPNNQSPEDRALLNDMWGAGLNDHPAKQRVVSALTPDEDDEILVKWRYSAFHRSPLEQMMKEMGRDQLVICGIYGHIGCMITATDAFMKDIKPFMVADAVADFSLEEHLMALKYVATRSGRVIFTEELLGEANQSDNRFSKESLKAQLLALIDENAEDFDEDENLIDYGLNSVHIMALVTEWRQQGIELSFVDLAKSPSLNGWWALFEKHRAAGAK